MSFRSKNLNAIQKRYPKLYEKLSVLKPSGRYRVVTVPGKPDMANLLDTTDNQLFYDQTDPVNSTINQIKERNIRVPNLNVFIGAGLLMNVFAFYKIFKFENHTNIIIEKDIDMFVTTIESVDISNVISNPNFFFIIDEDYTAVLTMVTNAMHNSTAKLFAKAINFIEDYKSYVTNKDYYLSCIKAVKEAISEVLIFFGNDPLDSLIGINHTFVNIREIIDYPGVKDLKDIFAGKPGIVVATGPSLMKNIDLLHEVEDKAVICSVDASMRVLRKHNLKPHVVTCLERVIATSKLFEDLKEEDTEDVFLAGTPVIHPLSYQNWPGDRFVVYRNFATFEWLNIPKGTLEIGPSAGNMAFKLLEYMGCDPIILIGQDLSYGEDDLTHADGTTYGSRQTGTAYLNNVEVPGNYKPKVKTTKTWNSFLNYYHKDVSASKSKVINATEGGAKIMGAELMTLREAIDKHIHEPLNVTETIKEHLHYPTPEEIKALNINTLETVNRGLDFCNKALASFKEGFDTCSDFEQTTYKDYQQTGIYNEEKGSEVLRKLESIAQIINSPDFYQIMMHYVQSYIIKSAIEINSVRAKAKDAKEEQINIITLSKDLYNVLIGLTEKMVKLMEDLRDSFEEEA